MRWKRSKVVLVTFLSALALTAVAGALYERYAVRRDARRFPPPGQLVDVGGRRLHLICIGSGRPVVLFEQAGFANSASFTVARTALAQHTRVCSYDRVGIGWSDPGPRTITVGLMAEDLRRLLDAGKIDQPIVLVASSIGGVTAEYFARRHPDRVAGLVFLDAGNGEAAARISTSNIPLLVSLGCSIAKTAGSVGFLRLIDPWDLRREKTVQSERSAALMYGAKPWVMLCGIVRGGPDTLAEFAAAPALRRELPVTALSAETRESLLPPRLALLIGTPGGDTAALRATHQHLAQGSAHGKWKVVPGSDHLIAGSQPQAVVDAVREMILAP
ncbi:MAG TPA: alpha/beta hydrolase [Vicinamibacterales bacterium]|nr:alpha/beta hydrolase [Vicinamibacterales bacterium]